MSAEGPRPGDPGEQPADAGERRLVAYLEELREDPPAADPELVRRVRRSARWQHAVRGPLQLVGDLGGALLDGIAAMLGGSRRSDR